MIKNVGLVPLSGLDARILEAEREKVEHGEVAVDYAEKIARGHPHVCIEVPDTNEQGFVNFTETLAGQTSFLGKIGVREYGTYDHYYIATDEVIDALLTTGLIDRESAGKMKETIGLVK